MNSAIVKGFFKFYPGIFHKKRSFSGIFRNYRRIKRIFSLRFPFSTKKREKSVVIFTFRSFIWYNVPDNIIHKGDSHEKSK